VLVDLRHELDVQAEPLVIPGAVHMAPAALGASNRLPALLETTVVASDGTVCRVTSPAILVLERPANDLAARRRRRARKKKRAAAAPGHHAH